MTNKVVREMSTTNMQQNTNPLAPQQRQKRKRILTKKDSFRCVLYIIVSICLVVSSTMIAKTTHHVPQLIEPNETIPPEPTVGHVNQMGGAFQSGIDEYEYEEVLTTVRYQPSETILIGGPRTQALGQKILTDVLFITTENDSVKWLEDEAEFTLEEISDRKLCIVSVGLNDLSNAIPYSQILNSWTAKFPDISFVFVNLGPIDESLYKETTNSKIQNFNNSMKSLLNDQWRYINLYGYLAENGIEAEDGVNYSETLNTTLFTWILQQADTEERVEYVPITSEGSSD